MVLGRETDGCMRSELIEMNCLSSFILKHSAYDMVELFSRFGMICYNVPRREVFCRLQKWNKFIKVCLIWYI